jgi:hypothetical protein
MMRRTAPVLRAAAFLVVIAFLGYQLWRVRHGIGPSLAAVGWRSALLATALAAIGGIPGFVGWRMLLAALEVRLPLLPSIQVYFLAGLTRYLPGGVWPALAHAAQARPLGVPPARMAGGYLAAQGVGVIAGVLVGLIALPALVVAAPLWLVLLPVAVLALVPVAVPRLFGPALALARRLLRRTEVTPPPLPGSRALAAVVAVMAVGWLVSGLHVAVLAIALGAPAPRALTVGVGGFALSVVGGIVAIVLPSGLGARELVLGLTLAGMLSGSALITLVALSRVLLTAGDLLSTAAVLGLLTIGGRAGTRNRPLEGASS